jgi:uncharacterized membrane protein YkvA (DUF1232 family)
MDGLAQFRPNDADLPMKSQPEATKPFGGADEASFSWEQVSLSAWRLSGRPLSLDEFIENRRPFLNSIDLRALRAFIGRLRRKVEGIDPDMYPGLWESVNIIVRVLESPTAQRVEDPLPDWLAETAFAAGYLLKEVDVIPDHLPEIGLADDALILRRVIERNEAEFQRVLAEPGEGAPDQNRSKESGIS